MSAELRAKITVTVDPEVLAAVDELAQRYHHSRSQTISLLLAERVAQSADEPRGIVRTCAAIDEVTRAAGTGHDSDDIDPTTCTHPLNQRRRFPWGSQCEPCGKINP